MNAVVRLELELANYNVTVHYISPYHTGTLAKLKEINIERPCFPLKADN